MSEQLNAIHELLDARLPDITSGRRAGLAGEVNALVGAALDAALRAAADDMEQHEPFPGEEPDWLREWARALSVPPVTSGEARDG